MSTVQPGRGPRYGTALKAGALAVGGLLGLLTIGGGWVYTSQLLPATARDRTFDITATVNADGTITLPAERRACPERFAILLEGGHFLRYGGAREGDCVIAPTAAQTVTREVLEVVEGDPPTGVPLAARFDEYVFLSDPSDAGLEVEEVIVDTELGPAEAWFVGGDRRTWVIFVHGRTSTRGETLRLMGPVSSAGYPSLSITYRNDFAGGPEGPDGVSHFGAEEWRDLRSAVTYAREEGAEQVVLVGYSQGASLVSFYLREEGSAHVAGVVLDSPLLDLPETLVLQAQRRNIPGPLIGPILFGTRVLAQLRAGVDVRAVRHVDALAELDVPVLLIHGDADDFVPVGPSDELAARAGDGLIYERIEGAGHVEGWNTDQQRYVGAVLDFLAGL